MAIIKQLRGIDPIIGKDTYLAETAVIIGDVVVGESSSVWFGVVLRGDVNSIRIGDRTNIQDGVVVHTLFSESPHPSQVWIGNDVSIGHNATIHGARIENSCLIGMGATLLDNAVVGSGSIVAAGSLVLAGTVIEPNSLWAGVPAKKVRDITEQQRVQIIERTARDYQLYASWYK